jgi:hypothetical protein
MKDTRNLLLEVTWTPKGVDLSKTNTGGIMPPAMKTQVENLRAELKSNGIELGKISSGFRDAYNQGRIMYANWFDLPKNKLKQGESVDQTIEKRRKYLVGLYDDTKATAVHNILAAAYKEDNDGKGGISPGRLTTALNDVEAYLEKNPISNHQGNQAIDVPPNSDLKKFIQSGKSKFAERCLDEGNHIHIKLRKYDGSGVKPTTNTQTVDTKSTNTTIEKVPVILMAGLNYRKGDKSTEEQGKLLSSGLGGITDVIAKDYTDLSGIKKEIDISPNSPIVLFSAGGSKAKQISKYVIEKGGDPNNIFISEPYTCNSGVKANVDAAIANGVPVANIIYGGDNCTGANVGGVSRKDRGGKSHWDGLKVAGQLVKEKLGSLLGQKTKIDNSSTNTSTNTQSLETQTTYTTKPKEMPSWKKKVFSVLDKLEENQKLNEEVYRIKDLIKKIL